MKKLLIVVGALLACVAVAVVTLSIVGLDPKDRRPGLWLTGELVTKPVTDWSFTDKYPTILVQTRAWYGLPHSVTTSCTAHNGALYLTSVYRPGGQFPRDPAEKDAVLETKAKKYPRQRVSDKRLVYVFRVQPG